jgi:hypothetical protein
MKAVIHSRSPMLALRLLSTAALAPAVVAPGPWAMDYILADGTHESFAGYWSKESCEGAIPKVTKELRGHNGRCFYNGLPVNGFTATEGTWPRPQQLFVSAYPSKEACEAAKPNHLMVVRPLRGSYPPIVRGTNRRSEPRREVDLPGHRIAISGQASALETRLAAL